MTNAMNQIQVIQALAARYSWAFSVLANFFIS